MIHSARASYLLPFNTFDLQFGSRLNLITGNNGLGKTYLLQLLWQELSGELTKQSSWVSQECTEETQFELVKELPSTFKLQYFKYVYESSSQYWRPVSPMASEFPHSDQVAPIGPAIYIRSNGCFSAFDLPRHGGAGINFTQTELWEGLEAKGKPICNGLISDLVTWQFNHKETFESLKLALQTLSDNAEPLELGPPSRFDPEDAREMPSLKMPYGEIPITLASAGMQRILTIAYFLVWTRHEHVTACKLRKIPPSDHLTILLDEVELHLHPSWQRLLMPALLKTVEQLIGDGVKLQIFATTHSSLVTASLEPHFDESRDALFHCQQDSTTGLVKIDKLPWHAMGEADAWLTSEVFGLKEPRSLPAEQAILEARKTFSDPNVSQDQVRAAHHRLQDTLGELDPFWSRWIYFAEKKGHCGVIPVQEQPEPAGFQESVSKAQDELLKALDVDPEKAKPNAKIWQAWLPEMHIAYGKVCAYLCVYIPDGEWTIDHFKPKAKPKYKHLAYSWQNFRLASRTMNTNKGNSEDVLDPFMVQDGWFQLEFSSLEVLPGPTLPAELHAAAKKSIEEILHLNDPVPKARRAADYDEYIGEHVDQDFLRRRSPFVYRELLRQGLL